MEARELEGLAYHLDNVGPTNLEDIDDLMKVIEADVVAVGEATHGTREFFRVKHKIFRYLVEERGFRLLGLEAGFAETLKINDFVLNGEGSADEVIKTLDFWTWRTEEVRDMINWIREFNKEADTKIKFYGFDMQYTQEASKLLYNEIEEENISLPEKSRDLLEQMKSGKLEEDIDEDDVDELKSTITSVKEISGLGELYTRLAEVIIQSIEFTASEESHRVREKLMAENILWLRNYERKEKMFLWAHNGHVSKEQLFEDGPKAMGAFLEEKLGDNYYAIGTEFYKGSFQAKDIREVNYSDAELKRIEIEDNGSPELASSLNKVGDILFLNFREAGHKPKKMLNKENGIHDIGAGFISEKDHISNINLINNFDGLLFIDKTTRARPLEKR